VFVGIGQALYLGPAYDTTPHAHHAIQICVGLDRPLRLRAALGSTWERHLGAVIRSDQPHQLDGAGCDAVLVYVEPESQDGRRLAVGDPSLPIQPIPPATVRAIRAAAVAAREGDVGAESAARLCREVLTRLGAHLDSLTVLDERIRRALLSIRADRTRPWRVGEVVRESGLSERRFRDLFATQVGMSCRQYLLWIRLYASLTELAGGAPLSQAASAAGFSDAAHLTRTFRRMVGIVPSAIARTVAFMGELG
jgi:AraC-like DNA-binding protein